MNTDVWSVTVNRAERIRHPGNSKDAIKDIVEKKFKERYGADVDLSENEVDVFESQCSFTLSFVLRVEHYEDSRYFFGDWWF